MSLLVEIHNIMKRDMPKPHERNFVAKYAKRAGAGVHKDKAGSNAPRNRQKQQWKREISHD